MRIAILTSGILPVPAVQGGAVENLVDFYLEYNNEHHLHDMTVYSVWHPDVVKHPALKSSVNHYHYIRTEGVIAKLGKLVYRCFHRRDEYYHYTIEYYLEQALRHIKKQNYDLVVLENRPGYALKMIGNTYTRLVYHLHNDILNNTTNCYQTVYQAATLILVVSDYIRKRVLTILPEDKKTQVVFNGINLSAFSCGKTICRNSIGVNPNDFLLVFSGRVTVEKGLMELVEAMRLLTYSPDIKLLILGSSFYGNTEHEDEFVMMLQEKSKSLGDRIIFTGFIPYGQMPAYLHLADLAVLPSVWEEPFGLTCVEAMAAGLPVVTTNRGAIPEVVDENCAVMLELGEQFVENLAAAILNLYQHPDKRMQMAKASVQRAQLFDKEIYAKKFFDAIESIDEPC